ncbi:pseudouridylate synthase RPUSD4, mitochondrial-like [Styela clava]
MHNLKKILHPGPGKFAVRYLRGGRITKHVKEDFNEIHRNGNNTEAIASRSPLHVLEASFTKSSGDAVPFEVVELQSEAVKPKKSEKILGRHIAEDIRSKKNKESNLPSINSLKCSNLSRMGQVEFARLLRKHVIYGDENLIVLNKPYGIAVHDEREMTTSLKSSLPILSKMIYGINTSIPLTLCNRLDKGTTGVTVCAANKDMAQEIIKLFRQQKIRKKFWAATVGTPSPRHGMIDIPLALRHIDGGKMSKSHSKMGLAPEQKIAYESGDMIGVRRKKSDIAITHYNTLDENKGLSLIEFQPLTTVKHQLRVHASEALSCCILGDHKYSYADNLLPQRLPRNILSMFNIPTTRSRDMPMHLHLREIVIPGILESANEPNLLVSAKPSEHMYRTMKIFRLKPGPVTEFVYPSHLSSKPKIKHNNPHMEELYVDPFPDNHDLSLSKEIQREDCYTVYKPRVKVKFQYNK